MGNRRRLLKGQLQEPVIEGTDVIGLIVLSDGGEEKTFYTDGMGLPISFDPKSRYAVSAIVSGYDGNLTAQSLSLQELHNGQPHGRRMTYKRNGL